MEATAARRWPWALTGLLLSGCEGRITEAEKPPPAPGCEATGVRAGAPRLWRINAPQYRATVGLLFSERPQGGVVLPPVGFTAPFAQRFQRHRYSTWAGASGLSEFDVDEAWASADLVASAWISRLVATRGHCLTIRPADDDCVAQTLGPALQRLWSRPPRVEELEGFVKVVGESRAELSPLEAFSVALRAALLSPQFLYRSELGVAGHLSSFEVASSLAASLTDGPPDAVLWQAAVADELTRPDDVLTQTRRLLGSSGEVVVLERFLAEYLKWDDTLGILKDAMRFPFHRPVALEDDTRRVVRRLVGEHARGGLLRALLTSDLVYVRRDTRESWGLTGTFPAEGTFQRDSSRAGIFTHPAWLSGNSENDHNHLVRRGRLVREKLLCGKVPSLPIGVVPGVEQTAGMSFRQRVAKHTTDAACWTCHQLMDPLGGAFEAWDHTGRPQQLDNGVPVDTRGDLTGGGQADGAYTDAKDLMGRLAASPEVQSCWVRQLFTFVRGRDITPSDRCELEALTARYLESGEDTLAVLEALHTSPAFLERQGNP